MPGVSLDLSNMKVSDLKNELKARGLVVGGNKDELRLRLEEALVAAGEVGLDEDVEVDEATEQALLEGKVPSKRVSFTAAAPEMKIFEKDEPEAAATDEGKTPQEKRAERFGMPMTVEAKKVARAARFGIVDPAEKKAARAARFGIVEPAAKAKGKPKIAGADMDTLKARAARFGEISSKKLKKVSLLEKKKERAEKFKTGVVKVPENKVITEKTVTAIAKHAPITMGDSKEAELKRKRAERFAAQ